ncbi:hypothetical protein BGZ65_008607, partial [Modicella reniformis]
CFVKNKAKLIKALKKSGQCDARALHRPRQELAGRKLLERTRKSLETSTTTRPLLQSPSRLTGTAIR